MNIDILNKMLDDSSIEVVELINNAKASEKYARTVFTQEDGFRWETVVPYVYRRNGLQITKEPELAEYLKTIKPYFRQESMEKWRREQEKNMRVGGPVTPLFFKVLLSFREEQERFPSNPNSARRIQDIKDAGYTVASIPQKKNRGYSRILLPLPLYSKMEYETFSSQFKARVIRLLKYRNAYEAKTTPKQSLIPDHKFSEVRWDEHTPAENSLEMSDEEIINKFQLLDNQRNLQKREICRRCFQEGIRGTIFGIRYFYQGNEKWDQNIPPRGKAAEKGCEGCPWYDIERWRKMLNEEINSKGKSKK